MNKRGLILTCMAASNGHPYKPVQIQKIVFLFQEEASELFETKPFNFTPYDYGPFDISVYSCLEELSIEGLVEIVGKPFNRCRLYRLSEEGEKPAKEALDSLDELNCNFLKKLSSWIRSVSFSELVGVIYKEYPEMRKNSIF